MSEIEKLIQELCLDGVPYKKLGQVCEKVMNIKWKNTNPEDYFTYVDLSSVDRNTHLISTETKISKDNAPSRAQQIIKTNDILFGTTRPTLMRYCYVPKELNNQICSTGYCVIRVDNRFVLPKWVYHYISSKSFYNYVEANQQGARFSKGLLRFLTISQASQRSWRRSWRQGSGSMNTTAICCSPSIPSPTAP